MALQQINPARPRQSKDALDRIAQGLQIAQGVLGVGLAIPEFLQKRGALKAEEERREELFPLEKRLKTAQASKLESEAAPLTDEQRLEIKEKFNLPDVLVPRTVGEAKSGLFQITPAERKKLEQQDRKIDLEEKKFRFQKAKEGKPEEKRKLSATETLKVDEGNAIPTTLSAVSGTIQNSGLFTSTAPLTGFARSINPFDTKAQVVDAEMRAASQQFGRFMEGGVLRKEDEEKYKRMFPKVGDTKAVAEGKLNVVTQMLRRKQQSNLKALEAQGFDISGLQLPPERKFVNGIEWERVEGGWREVTGGR